MVLFLLRRMAGALVIAGLLLPHAPAAGASPRIVGGSPAAPGAFPFQAGLMIAIQGRGGNEPDALCGGSLIAARWILTAAHCLAEVPVDLAHSYAVLGTTDLDHATPEQQFPWAETSVDPDFLTGAGGSDVGIIRLARPAPFQQVRLLRAGEAALYAPNTPATTAGWGYTEDPLDGGMLSTGALRAVGLRIYSDPECEQAFAAAGHPGTVDFTTELCALAPRKDSCNGDSGGPLLVPDVGGGVALAGAVSFGVGSANLLRFNRSCNEGPPGVYSRLGAEPLNAFVRSRVPQVEIDRNVAAPVPGQPVTFTARPRAPGGSGPFGGYDGLSWDLNGDGVFGERDGARSVTATLGAGVSAVSVRATSRAGDAEFRTVRVATQDKSLVAFSTRALTVREGRTARIVVRRVGVGAGTVTATSRGGATRTGSQVGSFAGGQTSRALAFATRADHQPSRSRTFSVTLGAFTGDLLPGTPMTARVTVVDDDLAVRAGPARAGRVRLRIRSGPGRVRVKGARATTRRYRSFGTHALSVRASGPGRLTVAYRPTGLRATVRRAVALR